MKTMYCVGFLFYGDKVLLIRKEKPEWQKGKLNGVGGKVEKGETARDAMVREMKEETGIVTQPSEWTLFCHLEGPDWKVECFCAASEVPVQPQILTDEVPSWFSTNELGKWVIPNLLWLIPMAHCAWDHAEAPTVQYNNH